MTLLGIIFALVAVGVVLWAINSFIPMDSKIRTILNVVVVIVVCVCLLSWFGVLDAASNWRVGPAYHHG